MTREQFMTALAGIKDTALVWADDVAWVEGASIGIQWVEGVALVWGFGWSEEVEDPDQIEPLLKKARHR